MTKQKNSAETHRKLHRPGVTIVVTERRIRSPQPVYRWGISLDGGQTRLGPIGRADQRIHWTREAAAAAALEYVEGIREAARLFSNQSDDTTFREEPFNDNREAAPPECPPLEAARRACRTIGRMLTRLETMRKDASRESGPIGECITAVRELRDGLAAGLPAGDVKRRTERATACIRTNAGGPARAELLAALYGLQTAGTAAEPRVGAEEQAGAAQQEDEPGP